jgi:hypothetical protein
VATGGAKALRGQRRTTAARGFKEDFDAWKTALTDDEKAQIQEQAENEYNKKFRKSDAYEKDLPEEKIANFGKILGKFFDAEAEDYKKEVESKAPDYDGLLKKAAEGGMDFSLTEGIVEVNRDADRRYQFASMEIEAAAAEGKKYPASSPLLEWWEIPNNDTKSHEINLEVLEFLKDAAKEPGCPEKAKAFIAEWEKSGIPAVGEPLQLYVPQVMMQQATSVVSWIREGMDAMPEKEAKDWFDKELPTVSASVLKTLTDNYVTARDDIESKVEKQKKFFRSQKPMPGKTKADVLKELWAELPKYASDPIPPLDDEMLAELAQEEATPKEELLHTWGTADLLYRSEAVDAFGAKYLLGIFETVEECHKAFDAWNAEYEAARKNLKEEMAQWSKTEQARFDADVTTQENVKMIFEEAKTMG